MVVALLLLFLLTAGCSLPGKILNTSEPAPAPASVQETAALVREAALPLTGDDSDYDPLMALIGENRFVLLGEATHGTHEFYRERARITQRLIREKGFGAIAIEGDWADADRVNRYVRGMGEDTSAEQALSGFSRFPEWTWRNTDVRDLVEWLRNHNQPLPAAARVGFYGLDLYGLTSSVDAVVVSLGRVDAAAARRARERYRCLNRYRGDPQSYGREAATRPSLSCERQAREQLQELELRIDADREDTGIKPREELFSALQNARVVSNAERYYRTLYHGGLSSWNLRDEHMADTLDELAAHLDARGKPAKVVVWAHNTHLGDARVTQMNEAGELNVGQLLRQRHDGEAVLVGFTTYTGTVAAASVWGERGQVKHLRPALPGSYSALFHETGVGNFLLPLRGDGPHVQALAEPRLERTVGVLYLPQAERRHYFNARLSQQFDAVVHLDETRAVEPLGRDGS
jgi:erythromycin esterase-like protein